VFSKVSFPENRDGYALMWKKNIVEPDSSQWTIKSMRIAC